MQHLRLFVNILLVSCFFAIAFCDQSPLNDILTRSKRQFGSPPTVVIKKTIIRNPGPGFGGPPGFGGYNNFGGPGGFGYNNYGYGRYGGYGGGPYGYGRYGGGGPGTTIIRKEIIRPGVWS